MQNLTINSSIKRRSTRLILISMISSLLISGVIFCWLILNKMQHNTRLSNDLVIHQNNFNQIPHNFKDVLSQQRSKLLRQVNINYHDSLAKFVGEFSDIATAHTVNIITIKPKLVKQQYQLEVELEGNYINCLKIIKNLLTSNYIYSIDKWNFKASRVADKTRFSLVIASNIKPNSFTAGYTATTSVLDIFISDTNLFAEAIIKANTKKSIKRPKSTNKPQPSLKPPFRLVGIINKKSSYWAVLEHKNGTILNVSQGQTIANNNYKVSKIEKQHLIITSELNKNKQWQLTLGN